MKAVMTAAVTAVTAMGISVPAYGEGISTESEGSIELLVSDGQNQPDRGGYLVEPGVQKTFVSAQCKGRLIGAGAVPEVATWSELRAVASVPRADRQPCDELIAMMDGVADDGGHGHGSRGGWVPIAEESGAKYRDARVGETYYLLDPDNHSDPTWGRSRIGWLVECDSVKFAKVDPIVAPGPGRESHHLHEFFGNPIVTSTTGTQSLADTPRSDIACTDVNDKSAYWSPAVLQDGERVTATNFKAYYKSTTANTVPMPLGLRMIAGDAKATKNQGSRVGWYEVQREDDLTPRDELTNTVRAKEMIARPDESSNIVLRVNFPNCWDGKHLDSPDHQSHVAYFDEETLTCPTTHPVKIPQLTTFTQYDVAGGEGFELTSGEWYTFHQDFWNAWSPAQMAELNETCILDELNCRVNSSAALRKLGQYPVTIPAK
jgi:hypothetical protein